MARFHIATLTPTKPELLASWIPTQPWCPSVGAPIELIGSYRFDDPDGSVGMEAHLVTVGDTVLHVPLTYRDEPLEGADEAFVAEMNHSVLGTRWIYDGLGDPLFVTMLTGFALTGQGEALGMARHEGHWYVAPSKVRVRGGGWTQERVPVDGFDLESADETCVALRSDRFELTVFRRPPARSRPRIGVTAVWSGQPDPLVVAELRERSRFDGEQ